jgi:hypothetical protein
MAINLNKSLLRSCFSTLITHSKKSPFLSVDGTVHYPVMHREISEFAAEFMNHRRD